MSDRPATTAFPIGVSTWVWTSPLDDQRLAELATRVAQMGFEVLELPIERVDDWDPGRASDVLGRLGLAATTCAVMSDGRDLTTTDRATTQATQAYLAACIERSAAVGSGVVAGPMYAPVGRTWREDATERRGTIGRLVEALRPIADTAGARGVRLALEPLNRFETSLINTIEQALEVVDAVDSPALGICLDTFHQNIEERDPAAAVEQATGRIAHVQACGTDRGAPGSDRFEWPRFVSALGSSGYVGSVCIESFTPHNDAIARAAAIWRPLAESPDRLAIDGLAFLRDVLRGDSADPARSTPVSAS
jgi:D-psicose/D-tagatose/L-ribulose 3-epimerase